MNEAADKAKLRNQRATRSAERAQERSRRRSILPEPRDNGASSGLDQHVVGFRPGVSLALAACQSFTMVWPYGSRVNGDGVVAMSVRILLFLIERSAARPAAGAWKRLSPASRTCSRKAG